MTLEFGLTDELTNTGFAPLAALGVYYRQHNILEPLRNVQIPMKTVQYDPVDKLVDALVSILAGCTHIAQINTQLRPELPLARAWGREAFAEQSTVSRAFDALTQMNLEALRTAGTTIWQAYSYALRQIGAPGCGLISTFPVYAPVPTLKGAPRATSAGEKHYRKAVSKGFCHSLP